MRAAAILLGLHLAVLVFGLAGMLIALPHPELWASNPMLVPFFGYGMSQGGASQMVLGAGAMLAYGAATIGWRRTAIFFAAACLISLAAETLGTSTGFPFGDYAYTDGLGLKIFGRVPFSVPLSWFYMGFAAYLLAGQVEPLLPQGWPRAWVRIVLGALLLTAWDLVLDPAMASPDMRIHFWVWHGGGAYFGMPPQNLIAWAATGAAFMAASRLLWRSEAPPLPTAAWLPFAVYAANLAFAIVLSLSVGIWPPSVVSLVLALLPLAGALRLARPSRGPTAIPA